MSLFVHLFLSVDHGVLGCCSPLLAFPWRSLVLGRSQCCFPRFRVFPGIIHFSKRSRDIPLSSVVIYVIPRSWWHVAACSCRPSVPSRLSDQGWQSLRFFLSLLNVHLRAPRPPSASSLMSLAPWFRRRCQVVQSAMAPQINIFQPRRAIFGRWNLLFLPKH